MNSTAQSKIEEQPVHVPAGSVTLEGNLSLPEGTGGIVLFAHGSGSSRHSPSNRYVAACSMKRNWRRCWSICSLPRRKRSTCARRTCASISACSREGSWRSPIGSCSSGTRASFSIGYFGASTGAGRGSGRGGGARRGGGRDCFAGRSP